MPHTVDIKAKGGRNIFIKQFLTKIKQDGEYIKTHDALLALKNTYEANQPDLSVLLIHAGVSIKEKTTTTPSWSYIDNVSKSPEKQCKDYAKLVEDGLFISRYRQYISSNHRDKIFDALIVKSSDVVLPSSYASKNLEASEEDPTEDVKSANSSKNDLAYEFQEIIKHSNYKSFWPIFKLIGLAIQGLHRGSLLEATNLYPDHRLLIYIDFSMDTTDELEPSLIGTPMEGKRAGRTNFLRKEIVLGGKGNAQAVMSTFLHEATHFVISEIYGQFHSIPYSISTADACKGVSVNTHSSVKKLEAIIIELSKHKKNLPPSLTNFFKAYETKAWQLKHGEIFSYLVEDLYSNQINFSEIIQTKDHLLYALCKRFFKDITLKGIYHYRNLLSKAMEKRTTMLVLAVPSLNKLSTLSKIKLDTLDYFDDEDNREYSEYEPNISGKSTIWFIGIGTLLGAVSLATFSLLIFRQLQGEDRTSKLCMTVLAGLAGGFIGKIASSYYKNTSPVSSLDISDTKLTFN